MARTDQRAWPFGLIAIAVLLVIARFTWSPHETSGTVVKWVSAGDAVERSVATGRPILYDFTADWCRPCHLLDAEVFNDPVTAREINERFIPVRVTDRRQEEGRNAAEVELLEQQYSIRGFPTVVFANAGGSELARMEGYKGRAEFARIMERIH